MIHYGMITHIKGKPVKAIYFQWTYSKDKKVNRSNRDKAIHKAVKEKA